MVHDGPAGLVEIWASRDGLEWGMIPGARDSHELYDVGSLGVSVSGDTPFAVVTNDGGPCTLWMGRFTD